LTGEKREKKGKEKSSVLELIRKGKGDRGNVPSASSSEEGRKKRGPLGGEGEKRGREGKKKGLYFIYRR